MSKILDFHVLRIDINLLMMFPETQDCLMSLLKSTNE